MNSTAKEFRQWIKAMEEWRKMNTPEKKEEKKKEEHRGKHFSAIEVFLLMIGCSPFIALFYKLYLIPMLMK